MSRVLAGPCVLDPGRKIGGPRVMQQKFENSPHAKILALRIWGVMSSGF
jgi:hypothetical protein